MPYAAGRACAQFGCPAIVRGTQRYCAEHERATRRAVDARRGSSNARGYDATWQRLRIAFLAQHPLCECEDCEAGAKRLTIAEVVDHIIPIAERPDLRLEWSNLRAMAKRCHDRRTARDQGWGRR